MIKIKKSTFFVFSALLLLAGCDNSSSDNSSSDVTPPPPDPTPSTVTKPVASNVAITDSNGILTGSYAYSNEDGNQEGKSLLYWRNNDNSVVSGGSSFSVTVPYLNSALTFCVTPVSFEGVQGAETCSQSYTSHSIELKTSMTVPTTVANQVNVYQNINIIPKKPSDYGLQVINIYQHTTHYIKDARDDYDGYNINDIAAIVYSPDNSSIDIKNFTPRTIVRPIVRIKLKSDGENYYYQVNGTLPAFTEIMANVPLSPDTMKDISEIQFIDPAPVYRLMVDHFVSPEDTDDYDPADDGAWGPILSADLVHGYNKTFYYTKYFNNRLGLLLHYLDYYQNKNVLYKNPCNTYMCFNADYSMHAWGRMAKSETNAKYYQLTNDPASGYATVGGTGLLRLTLADYATNTFSNLSAHEHGHNLGYSHNSGLTYGWPEEYAAWVKTQPYFDYIDGDKATGQLLNEGSDYTYHYEWVDNKTVKVSFMAVTDTAVPLTSLAIVAEDEQDTTQSSDDSPNLGVDGHQNNDFTVQSVNQIDSSTILITLKNPMRYMGNSLVIYAEPQYADTRSDYVSLMVYNSNDINIEDKDVGAFIVDAIDPDYKQQVYFNGSTALVGNAHTGGADNTGLDNPIGGQNLYNFPLDKYQTWDVNAAAAYCTKLGHNGLAKINTDSDSLTNLQKKYVNEAAIVALDNNGAPTIFKPGTDNTVGQIIACSID